MTNRPVQKRPIGIGLVGCGGIAQAVHLPLLTKSSCLELVALAEVDEQRLAESGRKAPGAVQFADYADLLRHPEVKAVIICLPTALHAEASMAALQAGKHVYLEKPLAATLADAQRILSVWRESGLVGMIGFNYRFNPLYEQARRQIAEGRLGQIIGGRWIFAAAASQGMPDWKRLRRGGGGALLELGSHDIDLVRFLLKQNVTEVTANVRSVGSQDDTAALQLHMQDGTLVQLFVSLNAVEQAACELYGNQAWLRVDRYRSLTAEVNGVKVGSRWRQIRLGQMMRGLAHLAGKLRSPANEPSYAAALAHFAGAVRGEHPASPDLLEGYQSLAVVAAAEESARTGRPVRPASLGLADEERAFDARCASGTVVAAA